MAIPNNMTSAVQTYVECASGGAVTEPLNGSWLQAYANFLGVTSPSNMSWLQAVCEHFGVTAPVNASWVQALALYYGIVEPQDNSWWIALAEHACGAPVIPFIWSTNTTNWETETRTWSLT